MGYDACGNTQQKMGYLTKEHQGVERGKPLIVSLEPDALSTDFRELGGREMLARGLTSDCTASNAQGSPQTREAFPSYPYRHQRWTRMSKTI